MAFLYPQSAHQGGIAHVFYCLDGKKVVNSFIHSTLDDRGHVIGSYHVTHHVTKSPDHPAWCRVLFRGVRGPPILKYGFLDQTLNSCKEKKVVKEMRASQKNVHRYGRLHDTRGNAKIPIFFCLLLFYLWFCFTYHWISRVTTRNREP